MKNRRLLLCQFLRSYKDSRIVWLISVFVNDNGPYEFEHRRAVPYINMLVGRDTGYRGHTINVSLRFIFFGRCPAVNYTGDRVESMLRLIVGKDDHHGPYAIFRADELAEVFVCALIFRNETPPLITPPDIARIIVAYAPSITDCHLSHQYDYR